MKHIVEEKIKVSKSRLLILLLITGIIILVLANSKNLLGISSHSQASNTEAQTSSRTYAITNKIALSDQWSFPPVETDNNQGMYYLVTKGQATEYEVRDADHPEKPYPFHHGETIHTDGVRIYRWQWRVSGTVISGPLELRYTVYQ